jgi:hypothetical protein
MLDNPVYKQLHSGQCAHYAWLSALRQLQVDVSEQYMTAIEWIGIAKVGNHLIKNGTISAYLTINTLEGMEFWLRKNQYLICGTWKMNTKSIHHSPHIQDFTGDFAHNFCIVPWEHPTLFKVKDSQWPDYADNGYWYMKKEDFRKIKKFRVYL